jgi:hypothetical protein
MKQTINDAPMSCVDFRFWYQYQMSAAMSAAQGEHARICVAQRGAVLRKLARIEHLEIQGGLALEENPTKRS